MIAEILKWFNPQRWLILAGVLAALAASVWGYGKWQHHLGYVERDDEQKVVENDRREQVAALSIAIRNVNQAAKEANDALFKAAGDTSAERNRVRNLLAERDRLRKSTSPAMPDAAIAAGCADDRARISEAAIDAARIAEQNADKVTGLQAWIERSRKEQTTALGQKDDRKPTDAEARLAARVKRAEDLAKRAEDRANGVLK